MNISKNSRSYQCRNRERGFAYEGKDEVGNFWSLGISVELLEISFDYC
jgi:hypothetical protein